MENKNIGIELLDGETARVYIDNLKIDKECNFIFRQDKNLKKLLIVSAVYEAVKENDVKKWFSKELDIEIRSMRDNKVWFKYKMNLEKTFVVSNLRDVVMIKLLLREI